MKLIITGGHHNSALVVAQDFIKRGHKVAWIGHKYAQMGDKNLSAEYTEVVANNIPFYNLKAGKSSLISLPRVPFGIYHAFKILKKEKPAAVISFGSYLGVAVVIAAWLQKIPVLFMNRQWLPAKPISYQLILLVRSFSLGKNLNNTFQNTRVWL